MTAVVPSIRMQSWAESLRLPCFMNSDEVAPLHTAVDPLRRPPVPLQSKHLPALKRGQWYALHRPAERARQGLLCVWGQMCVYVSGDAPTARFPTARTALLRLRVDPQFTRPGAGLTVFAATLCPAARRLWVEDVLVWKGRDVFAEEGFRARWCMAAQWLEHYCIVDPALVDGLELVLGRWASLDQVKPEGVWMIHSEESGRRPLLWNATAMRHDETAAIHHSDVTTRQTLLSAAAGGSEVSSPVPFAAAPKLDVGPLIAVAVREAGPDQWSLFAAEGVSVGRALIRTLEVSVAMRPSARLFVEVEWNDGFKKWEVKAVCTAGVTATASAFFTRDK
jgi:hypothetical protein